VFILSNQGSTNSRFQPDPLRRIVVADDTYNEVISLGPFSGAARPLGAGCNSSLGRFGLSLPHRAIVTGAQKIGGHALAHRTESEKSYFAHADLLSAFRADCRFGGFHSAGLF